MGDLSSLNKRSFAAFVKNARAQKLMRNDDVTVVTLNVRARQSAVTGGRQAPPPTLLGALPPTESSRTGPDDRPHCRRREPMPLTPGWPNYVAYQDAIQAPQVCFTSQRLKAVQIRTNDMGLPQAATGRSAIVFRAGMGYKDIALRCFTREAAGQQSRYRALHEHLTSSIPRYMVDFVYRDREILVEGKRYPVVEMGWAEGESLHLWVEQHLRCPYHFVRLADIWWDIVKDLEIRGMAHGDLSSDNCLVIGDNLTLIDYDDFFIWRLEKSDPGEGGTRTSSTQTAWATTRLTWTLSRPWSSIYRCWLSPPTPRSGSSTMTRT